MDPGQQKFRAFWVCQEDASAGVPVRLVGESDFATFSATEEVHVELDRKVGDELCDEDVDLRSLLSGRAAHRATRVRLTSHRLIWRATAHNCWLALRLDEVASVEPLGGVMRSKRCLLRLQSGLPVYIKGATEAMTDQLIKDAQRALAAAGWKAGSFEAAAQAGLQRLLNQQSSKQQATGATLDVALADLDSLRRNAAEAVKVARQVASAHSGGYGGSEAGKVDKEVGKLLEDFGLLQEDGSTIATGGQSKADILADVTKICTAALERKGVGGMLLAHDAFCLVNRARGTALVSPTEVMKAIHSCCKAGGPLRMRKLGSVGAVAVSLARTSDSELDGPLLKILEEGPLSAFRVATELKITAAEARYLLHDAEQRAVLVRDDAPECVYFYRNFFNDF